MAPLIAEKLANLYRKPVQSDVPASYEARVLHGIWAAAPYLHNGSVPSLWELLTPPADRKSSFIMGSRTFDSKNVGFVTDQSSEATASFIADPANGNGNSGHDFGTDLTTDERWQLIEYLKTL